MPSCINLQVRHVLGSGDDAAWQVGRWARCNPRYLLMTFMLYISVDGADLTEVFGFLLCFCGIVMVLSHVG